MVSNKRNWLGSVQNISMLATLSLCGSCKTLRPERHRTWWRIRGAGVKDLDNGGMERLRGLREIFATFFNVGLILPAVALWG